MTKNFRGLKKEVGKSLDGHVLISLTDVLKLVERVSQEQILLLPEHRGGRKGLNCEVDK